MRECLHKLERMCKVIASSKCDGKGNIQVKYGDGIIEQRRCGQYVESKPNTIRKGYKR